MGTHINGVVNIHSRYKNGGVDIYGPDSNIVVDSGIGTIWKRLSSLDELDSFMIDRICFGSDYGMGTIWEPESPTATYTKDNQVALYYETDFDIEYLESGSMKFSMSIDGDSFMDTNFPNDISFYYSSLTVRFANGDIMAYKRVPIRVISRGMHVDIDWTFSVVNSDEYCA